MNNKQHISINKMSLKFLNQIKKLKTYKNIELLIIIILLLPLFFINVSNYHDWGGDFAQYIQQGINIAECKTQSKTHYIFNPENSYIGPPSYNVGFPLLLAPVYTLFGNKIIVFSYFISFFLIITMILVFKLLKQHFGLAIGISATLIFSYNPWLLKFKGEVLSDIPFTMFFLAGLLLYEKNKSVNKKTSSILLLGFFIAYSMLIKNIGLLLIIAIIIDGLVTYLSSKNRKMLHKQIWLNGMSILTALGVYIIVGIFIFPSKQESYSFFYTLFNFGELDNIILNNLDYYITIFQNFFHHDNANWNFAPLITKAFALTFLIVGLFLKFSQKPSIKEYLFVLYLFVILSFPNSTQGFRYLLPIFPIILYFIVYGISSVKLKAKINKYIVVVFITLFIGLQYKIEIKKIINQSIIANSPQSTEAIEAFNFILNNTDKKAKIVFKKPRVLGLYANRDSYSVSYSDDKKYSEKQLNKFGFDYLLLCSDLGDVALKSYINDNKNKLLCRFSNKKFTLYKVKK